MNLCKAWGLLLFLIKNFGDIEKWHMLMNDFLVRFLGGIAN